MGILKSKFILYRVHFQDQSCNEKIRTLFTTCSESISSCLGIHVRFIYGKLKLSSRIMWQITSNDNSMMIAYWNEMKYVIIM